MNNQTIKLSNKKIPEFCQRWQVTEFALFGSALRDDFSEQSDVDVLVSFADGAEITLLDLAQMQIELEQIFNRSVDLVEKAALRNPYRRQQIIDSAQVVYEY